MAVLAAVIALGGTTIAVAEGANAAPPYNPEERALAIASPSLVYLETAYTGLLRDKKTKALVVQSPVAYNRRCSGFVVNSDGHVVTSSQCVQPAPETLLENVLYKAGRELILDKKLASKDLETFVKSHLNTDVFTGVADGQEPDAQLYGQFNVATGAATEGSAIKASVVKATPREVGNVALIKLETNNLPSVVLNTSSTPAQGSSAIVLGFATSDQDVRVGTYTMQSKTVQVTGTGSQGQRSWLKTNDDVGTDARGGLAVDTSGLVIGMLDEDTSVTGRPTRAVAPVSLIMAVLNDAKVSNAQSSSDKKFRSALDAYFGGRYSTSVKHFDAVIKSTPVNQVAKRYRDYAADRSKMEKEPSSATPGWVVPVAAAGGGALIVTLIALLVMGARRRARARERDFEYTPAPLADGLPYGAPVSGMPTYGAPVSGVPTYGPGMPMGGPPVSGVPTYGAPVSGVPTYGAPVSGMPMYGGGYGQMPGTPIPHPPTPNQPMPGMPVSGTPLPSVPAGSGMPPVSPPQPEPVLDSPWSQPPQTVYWGAHTASQQQPDPATGGTAPEESERDPWAQNPPNRG
jgi:hypothetical protein